MNKVSFWRLEHCYKYRNIVFLQIVLKTDLCKTQNKNDKKTFLYYRNF